MPLNKQIVTMTVGVLLTAGAQVFGSDAALDEMAMFGINRSNAKLTRYDFAAQQHTEIGTIRDAGNTPLLGIDASAYVPGFGNLFAFWYDSSVYQNKLVYVDAQTAQGTVVQADLEGGRIAGAVAVGPVQETAASFDGQTDFVVVPHSDAYLLDNGTIVLRFKANDLTGRRGLFSKDSNDYDTGGHVTIYVESSLVKARIQTTSGSHYVTSTTQVQPDSWYHVALTFGSGGMKLYVDGAEEDTNAHTGGLGATSGGSGNLEPIVIGANQWASGNLVVNNLSDYFDGQIGHVEVLSNALTPIQIAEASTAIPAWTVYAIQHEQVSPPVEISGQININPNNSPHNEFTLTKANGDEITRDDLHQNSPVDGDGNYYEGDAVTIHVKPKGNGNQNSLVIDGQAFVLQNSNTYIFTGEMAVRVYNDHIHTNGKAMGHWWVEITSGTIILDDVVTLPSRLVKVDHQTGLVTEVMPVERAYDGLASIDGQTFYAVCNNQLYQIDSISETETLVGTLYGSSTLGMEFAGSTMMCFEMSQDRLAAISTGNGALLGSPMNVSASDLGTITFFSLPDDPEKYATARD